MNSLRVIIMQKQAPIPKTSASPSNSSWFASILKRLRAAWVVISNAISDLFSFFTTKKHPKDAKESQDLSLSPSSVQSLPPLIESEQPKQNEEVVKLNEQIKITQTRAKKLNELSEKLEKIMDDGYHDQLRDVQKFIKNHSEKTPQTLIQKLQECTEECEKVIESDNRQAKVTAFTALRDAMYDIRHHFTMNEGIGTKKVARLN